MKMSRFPTPIPFIDSIEEIKNISMEYFSSEFARQDFCRVREDTAKIWLPSMEK